MYYNSMDKGNNIPNKTLLIGKDVSLDSISGKICRVISFVSLCDLTNSKSGTKSVLDPYGIITIETSSCDEHLQIALNHKTDFNNIKESFKYKKDTEEVLVGFDSSDRSNVLFRIFTAILPKLSILLCKEGSYKLLTDPEYQPELQGEARWSAARPIREWKPRK